MKTALGHRHLKSEHGAIQEMLVNTDAVFVLISVQMANNRAKRIFFCDNTSGEDLRGDNDVVITCAKSELWMFNEL